MRHLLFFSVLVVCVGIGAQEAQGQQRAAQQAFEALATEAQARVVSEDPVLRFRTQAVPGGRLDMDAGVLRAAYRIGRRMPVGLAPEATAKAYLVAEAARFGWTDAEDLTLETVSEGRYNTHITYQQTFAGVPVHNRRVKISLNSAGQPTMVMSSYASHLTHLDRFNTSPSLTPTSATARVQRLVSSGGARTSTPELVVYAEETPRLAWRMLAWPDGIPAEWEVLLDAHSGALIYLLDQSTHAHSHDHTHSHEDGAHRHADARAESNENNTRQPSSAYPSTWTTAEPPRAPSPKPLARADGTGLVFDPDPITTAGVEYGAPYVDAADTDVQALNDERLEVALLDITLGSDGLYRLEGPFVRVDGSSSVGGTAYTPPAEAAPDGFKYSRADDDFEAVMVYYHIDKSQRYVQELDVGRDIQAVPVPVNPHGLGNADDSRYYPGINSIALGDGGIDDAEDADVIWHEYGHALLQGSATGLLNNDEGRALHEGWADYWAASYSRGLIEAGKVPGRDWRKVFTWDGNETWNGRSLDRQGRYPEDTSCDNSSCGSAIYSDGLLWATTLMEIYDEVTREVIDRLNLASHGYLGAPVTFVDAAEALIQADLDLYGGEHLGAIIDRLGARGYIDPTAFGPILAHEPLPHVEDTNSPVTIAVEALAVGAPVTSVLAFYSVNGGNFDVLTLTAQGDDRFSGMLTLPAGANAVNYYLEAVDQTGLRTVLPAGAPQNTFSFVVGEDTEAPVITHEPLEQISIQTWPARVVAQVADNQGVDSVWVEYTAEEPSGAPFANGFFGLTLEDDQFVGTFPIEATALEAGSTVRYRLYARDIARTPNETLLPVASAQPFVFTVVVAGVLASFDFEIEQGLQATGAWVRGVPTYGVQTAHSGERVWATGVDVPYPDEPHQATLELPPFNLQGFQDAYLVFWHWYDFEHSGIEAPGPASSGTLWDGGNIKVSSNDGASWTVVEPLGGYTGSFEQGTVNPLQGERAFGGYSFGWRRVVVPLPNEDNLRIRFDFGSDGSNDLASLFYAGWYIDDVRVVTELEQDATPPTVVTGPPSLVQIDAGRVPPPLVVEATDNVGVESVLVDYDVFLASGGQEQGVLRLAMSPADLTTFLGTFPTTAALGVGDRIEYRMSLRDFDGNTTVFPANGQSPLRIEYRLAESVSALQGVRTSGLWRALGQGYTTSGNNAGEAVSGLVLAPFDLPDNTETITFTLSHAYRFGEVVGGNLKISVDDGASWTVLIPQGAYGASYAPGGSHPMQGEGVFAGQSGGLAETIFNLSEFAGRQVRLRVDLGTTRALEAAEFWTISQATLSFSTLESAFEVPRELALHANFPDPFFDSTTISYTLPEAMPVRLELYNMLGQRIAVLVDGQKEAGTHTLTMGRGGLAGGVYLLRMMAGGTQSVERMIITR